MYTTDVPWRHRTGARGVMVNNQLLWISCSHDEDMLTLRVSPLSGNYRRRSIVYLLHGGYWICQAALLFACSPEFEVFLAIESA